VLCDITFTSVQCLRFTMVEFFIANGRSVVSTRQLQASKVPLKLLTKNTVVISSLLPCFFV
jgi:hypothetical protein